MDEQKPRLFIDIDGVIYAHYAGQWQIRPYVVTLTRWAVDHFDIWWASWNSNKANVISALYLHGTIGVIAKDWDQNTTVPRGKLCWIEAHGGFDKPWLLIEDTPPCDEERKFLLGKGLLQNWIVVPDTGSDILLEVKCILERWVKDGRVLVPTDWVREMGAERDLCTLKEWTGYADYSNAPVPSDTEHK